MKDHAPDRVRRVSVTDAIAAARRYDYADAIELRLEGPDRCSPEEWVRAGVDATPSWIKRIVGHPDGLGSARIVESDADVVVLEDFDPLMDTVIVGRNRDPERRVLTTILRYRRPLLARAIWALVGILHRRTARQVVAGGLRHERARGMDPLRKRKLSRLLERHVVNPQLRFALGLGIAPSNFALLETPGRGSGRPRRTPVGNELRRDTFWLVAEHGERCHYVKNLLADPNVRVKVGHEWRTGIANPLPEDDGLARRRQLDRGHGLGGRIEGAIFRATTTQPLTIRIDLEPVAAPQHS